MPVALICEQCNKEFKVAPSVAKKNRRFCSRTCHFEWERSQRILLTCTYCGKEFERYLSQRDTNNYFCSRKCWTNWHKQSHVSVKCEQCGKVFDKRPSCVKENNFCSSKCYHTWRAGHPTYCDYCSKEITRSPSKYKDSENRFCSLECHKHWRKEHSTSTPYQCDYCRKEITVRRYEVNTLDHHFCSRKCHGKFVSENYSGENSAHWQGGISYEPYDPNFDETKKDQVRSRDNYICQLCGMTQPEHLQKYDRQLAVHHINYDKQDSQMNNLISLCIICHSKTNYRRQYYQRTLSGMVTSNSLTIKTSE